MGENYSQNFKYLDDLIHRGFEELTLDSDIILDDDEKVIYYNGINLECDDIIIDGNYHTIDAKHNARIFNIKGKNITIKNITLINTHCDEGGAIYNNEYSNLTLFNVTFINNSSTEDGGAIVNFGEISCSHSNFLKNNARCGGAIFNQEGAILNFIFSDFKENTANVSGGAIKNNGTANLENCDFKSHCAISDGGVIFNQDFGVLRIMKNNFKENSSKYHGGVITNKGNIIIENSEFNNNSSINSGGAIHNQKGSMTIIKSKFGENYTAKKHGEQFTIMEKLK